MLFFDEIVWIKKYLSFSRAFHQSKLALINKVYLSQKVFGLYKITHTFVKDCHKEYIFKTIKQKLITLSWSSWKSNRDIFFEYFPWSKFGNAIHYEFWYFYEMKAWLFYIRLTYSTFLDRLEFQVNQQNIHPTLTTLKLVLALKPVMQDTEVYSEFSRRYIMDLFTKIVNGF